MPTDLRPGVSGTRPQAILGKADVTRAAPRVWLIFTKH